MTKSPTHTSRYTKPRRAAESRPVRPCKAYVRKLPDGVNLEGEVSPCVFMYPGYPLQIRVTLRRNPGEPLGHAYAVDRLKTADTATGADVRRLIARTRIVPCLRCATPAFDPATIETNRTGLCESCFLHDLDAALARAEEAERQEQAERDRRRKAEGMTFRVYAWVHPEAGGDDYAVNWYFAAAPTVEQIQTLLREEESSILHDYRVIAL